MIEYLDKENRPGISAYYKDGHKIEDCLCVTSDRRRFGKTNYNSYLGPWIRGDKYYWTYIGPVELVEW